MGQSIDLYSYDYEKLVNRTLEVCNTNNRELIEQILSSFGNKVSDRYILLNQELWDGYSCYYNVARVLNKVFKVEGTLSNIFGADNIKIVDREDLIVAMDMDEILDSLDINNVEEN